jgi:16S rRNA processing protein RimM
MDGTEAAKNKGDSLPEWTWTIGEVVGVFGIVGELKVRIETDFPERFTKLAEAVLRGPNGAARLFKVKKARLHKGQALLKLEGIDRIEDAEVWRGARVQVRPEERVALPEDSFYASDIIGLEVVTKDGRALGKLEKILPYPAQDLFQIGEILIPAVKEFIVEVDIPGGRIIVDPPQGLLPDETPEEIV